MTRDAGHRSAETRIPPMPKGTVAANFLSMTRTFECIVNALFCCLDIDKTANSGFTLSVKSNFFDYFLNYFLIC